MFPESTRALPKSKTTDPEDAPTRVAVRAKDPPLEATARLRPGTLVDRYLVLHHLGSGGLGDVYAAYDTELERKIAIKLVRPPDGAVTSALGDLHARALREAQALARLRHPNVVAVHDVGTHDAHIFLAMELVEGRTITTWLQERTRSWRESRDVFVQAGQGLAAAHAAGLVHRDFKLGNVIVATDGRVVVLDFGLARALDVGAASTDIAARSPSDDAPSILLTEELTDTRVVLGTPQYLAPELWSGAPATARSDVFAFCVALYRALYDRFPFAATTSEEHKHAALEGRVEPPPAGARVPPWLHRAVVRGLHGDAGRRFDSIDALLGVLQTDRRRRRRRVIALLVAVPLFSAGAAATAVALRPEPTAQEIDAARRTVDEARAAAARGHYVYPPAEAPHEPTAISKLLELEAMAGDQARDLAAGLRTEMADALVALGDRYYERPGGPPFAVDFYAAALVFDPDRERARERVTLTPGQLADLSTKARSGAFTEAELVAAESLAVLADVDEARRAEKARRLLTRSDRTSITTRERLGAVLEERDEELARAEPAKQAISPSRDALNPDAPASAGAAEPGATQGDAQGSAPPKDESDRRDLHGARAAATEGRAALGRGDLAAASAAFNRALQLDRRNLDALLGLAELHYERGEYHKARTFAKRATAVTPKSGAAWILLGDASFKVLDYDAARDAYARAQKAGARAAKGRIERLDKLVGGRPAKSEP
jgi:tetratricopeptide (TPR) repeat protein